MKIKVILLTFFIYISYFSPLWGQTTGKITDTKQQPIEGATIVMQLPDSTYLGAAISAADGTFTLVYYKFMIRLVSATGSFARSMVPLKAMSVIPVSMMEGISSKVIPPMATMGRWISASFIC